MADSVYLHRELRIVLNDDATLCYAYLEGVGDCPHFVTGWHFKSFPPTMTTIEILQNELVNAIMWPPKDPELPRVTQRYGAVPGAPLPLFLTRRIGDGWAIVLTEVSDRYAQFEVHEWRITSPGQVVFGSFADPASWKSTMHACMSIMRGVVRADGTMTLYQTNGAYECTPEDLEAYAALPKEAYRYAMGHIPGARLDDQLSQKPDKSPASPED